MRSAGLSPKARRVVNAADLDWADMIFVMEQKHKSRLTAQFGQLLRYREVYVLDIPDDYRYMDPDLVELLEVKVGAWLDDPETD